MNSNPELASTWKGRILMQVLAFKSEKPFIKVLDIPEEVVTAAYPFMQPHEYEVIAEVGMGIALPWAGKFNVKIRIAEFELKTEKP